MWDGLRRAVVTFWCYGIRIGGGMGRTDLVWGVGPYRRAIVGLSISVLEVYQIRSIYTCINVYI